MPTALCNLSSLLFVIWSFCACIFHHNHPTKGGTTGTVHLSYPLPGACPAETRCDPELSHSWNSSADARTDRGGFFCMCQTEIHRWRKMKMGFSLHMFYADPLSRILPRWVSRGQCWGIWRQQNRDPGEELCFFHGTWRLIVNPFPESKQKHQCCETQLALGRKNWSSRSEPRLWLFYLFPFGLKIFLDNNQGRNNGPFTGALSSLLSQVQVGIATESCTDPGLGRARCNILLSWGFPA